MATVLNWERIHGTIGIAPMNRFLEPKDKTSFWGEVINNYDQSKESLRDQNDEMDRWLAEIIRCL